MKPHGKLFARIAERLVHAKEQHPEGARFPDLLSEINEVQNAIKNESPERVVDELLDVAAVSVRMIEGIEACGSHGRKH